MRSTGRRLPVGSPRAARRHPRRSCARDRSACAHGRHDRQTRGRPDLACAPTTCRTRTGPKTAPALLTKASGRLRAPWGLSRLGHLTTLVRWVAERGNRGDHARGTAWADLSGRARALTFVLIELLCSSSSCLMRAICATGPPHASAPNRRNRRNRRPNGSAGARTSVPTTTRSSDLGEFIRADTQWAPWPSWPRLRCWRGPNSIAVARGRTGGGVRRPGELLALVPRGALSVRRPGGVLRLVGVGARGRFGAPWVPREGRARRASQPRFRE